MPAWLRNILLAIALLAVVILSFWISFMLGKQMLVPVKKLPPNYLITGEATLPPPLSPDKISIEVEDEKEKFLAAPPVVEKKAVRRKARKAAPSTWSGLYCVQAGVFRNAENAERVLASLKDKGFAARRIVKGQYNIIMAGENLPLIEARDLMGKVKALGIDAVVRRN